MHPTSRYVDLVKLTNLRPYLEFDALDGARRSEKITGGRSLSLVGLKGALRLIILRPLHLARDCLFTGRRAVPCVLHSICSPSHPGVSACASCTQRIAYANSTNYNSRPTKLLCFFNLNAHLNLFSRAIIPSSPHSTCQKFD